MSRDIWAKSRGNARLLKDHIEEMLKQGETLKRELNLDDNIYKILRLAILSHDFGKVSPSFQISIGNYDYCPKTPFPDIPHSIFSLFWIDINKLPTELNLSDIDIKILLSAVAFHHWRDYFHEILLGEHKITREAAQILLDNNTVRDKLEENLKEIFKELNIKEDFIGFNTRLILPIGSGHNILNLVFPPYLNYFLPYRADESLDFKKKNVYISGFLMRIDHFASYLQQEGLKEEIEKSGVKFKEVKNNIIKGIEGRIGKKIEEEKIWQINSISECKEHSNIILVAPTGSGKTEFAYLWGSNKRRKIIFTLPLRSASNAIFLRAVQIFGKENVGLLHSDADICILELSRKLEGESPRVLDLSRQLSLPVLISTGDQFFPSALKYPGYEKIYATLGFSNLVIDEVQAYDPRAVAIVVKLLEDIVKLGGNFLLMTATLPEFVREEIKKRVGEENFKYIDRYENLSSDIIKHKVKLRKVDIEAEEVLDEIVEKAKAGNRILIIANTVRKSQDVFERLGKKLENEKIKEVLLYLLHANFTLKDRRDREKILIEKEFKNPKPENEKNGKIFVATQIVEASLDIDADYLYTEIAPLDSLIQRMGRVLRRVNNEQVYKYEGEPNINIFFIIPEDKGGVVLESGKGGVYESELLFFSLCVLLKEIKFISEEDIRGVHEKSDESYKKERDKIFKKLNQEFSKSPDDFVLEVPEKSKKDLVEELYKNLPSNSSYLKSFYDTLTVLDSGYVSENKNEALRIFRTIYSVSAIPESLKDKFLEDLKNYVEKANEFNYTSFKEEIISKYCVNVDIRRYLRYNTILLKKATELIPEVTFKASEDRIEKIIHWLSDIYYVLGNYDSNLGFIPRSSES